jgi:TRAP-type C4-dicarboxylate transport system substrate-binding protein
MKKERRTFFIAFTLVLILVTVIVPVLASRAQAVSAQIKLNFVSFISTTNVEFIDFKELFIDRVNQRAKGDLIINVRGATEVIAPFDLGLAVHKGTIDMALVPSTFFDSLVPGAIAVIYYKISPDEERKSGAEDYLRQMCAKKGIYYLGRTEPTEVPYFYLFLNKLAQKLEDFRGLKLGGAAGFHDFYRALGASPVMVPSPELYTAMERNVVDGLSTSLHLWVGYGGHEVTKYMIDHPFYQSPTVVIMNLGKWNGLPKHLQRLLTDCLVEHQKGYSARSDAEWVKEKQKMREAGVKFITFSPDVAKQFIEIGYDAGWRGAEKKYPGEDIPRLRKLTAK